MVDWQRPVSHCLVSFLLAFILFVAACDAAEFTCCSVSSVFILYAVPLP